jgi:hypothetical protein
LVEHADTVIDAVAAAPHRVASRGNWVSHFADVHAAFVALMNGSQRVESRGNWVSHFADVHDALAASTAGWINDEHVVALTPALNGAQVVAFTIGHAAVAVATAAEINGAQDVAFTVVHGTMADTAASINGAQDVALG